MKEYSFRAYYEDGDVISSIGNYKTLSEVRDMAIRHAKHNDPIKIEIFHKDSVYETSYYKKVEEEKEVNMTYQNYYRIKITREDNFTYYEKCYYKSPLRAIEDAQELSKDDEYKEVEVIKYVPELLKKVKEKPQYHVLYGMISKNYYVFKNKNIPFACNVYIKTYNTKEEAQNHADELNKFVEGK